MSFSGREIVRWLGKPVELYRFTRQSVHWRYTSADAPITVGPETFAPLAISHGSIVESFERLKRELTVTLPADAAVCANWAVQSPGDPVALTILAKHRGDDDVAVHWVGRVLQPRFTDTSCELLCQPGAGSLRPRGLQLRWQRGCPYALYSQGLGMCNLNPAHFDEPAVLSAVNGAVISAAAWAALPAGRLGGGYVEWTALDGLVHRRTITAHAGANLNLDYSAPGLAAGATVKAYHGCAHDYADCTAKGNGANYGGCTNLPAKDPFAGHPIWW